MKEFVEKLIEQLEELQEKYKGIRANTHCVVTETSECDSCKADNYLYARLRSVDEVIKIVNQLAEEYIQEKTDWIPCEERFPDTKDYILLSFSNFSVPVIGRWEEDEEGGAFYIGDDMESCVSQGMVVNAWQQLPKVYRQGEEKDGTKNARTRIERIRSMSVEEIADKIMENENLYAALNFCRNYAKCWEEVMLQIGDKVKMNDKYYVSDKNKERVFTVKTEPQEVGGTLCVWLEGYRGCYAVDGLSKV